MKAAVVLMAYGSPERLADVPAYYSDIRGGRGYSRHRKHQQRHRSRGEHRRGQGRHGHFHRHQQLLGLHRGRWRHALDQWQQLGGERWRDAEERWNRAEEARRGQGEGPEVAYPRAARKTARMLRRLAETGFVSFLE